MGHAKNCTSGDCLCHRYKAQLKDKHTPILGEMDTIDCLRKERDALRAEVNELRAKNSNQFLQNAELIFTADEQLVQIDLQSRQIGELVEALKKISGMERMTFAECTDAEFIMDTANEAIRSVEQGEK